MDNIDGLHSDDLLRRMEQLKDKDLHEFAILVYDSMVQFPEDVYTDGVDPDFKTQAIQKLLDYFISIEEYEKCSTLQKFIDDINERKE